MEIKRRTGLFPARCPLAEDFVGRVRVHPDRLSARDAAKLFLFRPRVNEERVGTAQAVRGERPVDRRRFVRRNVMAEKNPRGALPRTPGAPRRRPERRTEEGMPPGDDDEIRP